MHFKEHRVRFEHSLYSAGDAIDAQQNKNYQFVIKVNIFSPFGEKITYFHGECGGCSPVPHTLNVQKNN